jgi:hypothetical protein
MSSLCSGGDWFESWPGHRLSWMRFPVDFLSPSMKVIPQNLPSTSFPIHYSEITLLFSAYSPHFEKVGLWDHHAVYVFVYPPYQHLNAWSNLYKIWYVYCNGFGQSVSRQWLGKHVPTCNKRRCVPVDEYYSSLLGNSQLANELTGYESHNLCFLCCPCGTCIKKTCCSLD